MYIFSGPSSFNILEGHSKATMFLICNNAAQGILSSFFFKYAGILPANKAKNLNSCSICNCNGIVYHTCISENLLSCIHVPRKDYLGLAFILGVERLRFYWCVGQINLFVAHVVMAIQEGVSVLLFCLCGL